MNPSTFQNQITCFSGHNIRNKETILRNKTSMRLSELVFPYERMKKWIQVLLNETPGYRSTQEGRAHGGAEMAPGGGGGGSPQIWVAAGTTRATGRVQSMGAPLPRALPPRDRGRRRSKRFAVGIEERTGRRRGTNPPNFIAARPPRLSSPFVACSAA
jgi:hypothetical protein